jgi:alpha-glucosidase (family GH31 glycosyl hydrolase)
VIAAVAAAPAGAETLASGTLRAETSADPWHLAFHDARGALLSEHAATGNAAAGTLGFRTALGWAHATRVISSTRDGEALVLELATTDPLRRMEARLEPAGEGVMRLDAKVAGEPAGIESTGIGFDAVDSERYLGFGERSTAVDQRGQEVETYVGEGPYQREERPFISPGFVPPWGFRSRDDASYFPMPWLLSTRGYGVLAENTHLIRHRLASERPDAWSVEVDAPAIRLLVMAGPKPADVVRRLTLEVGRQPPAAPFFFGAWFQPSGDEQSQTRKLIAADAPVSVAQTYLHYLPCGDQRGSRDRERERTAFFHEQGLATTTYFNPMVCVDYTEAYDRAAAAGALTRDAAGRPYVYRYLDFTVSQFDFSAEPGRQIFRELLTEAVEDGHDGWMEDFGEYTPLDSRSANGMDGEEMHNLYPVQYHCTAQEFARTQPRLLARFVRSGYTNSHSCSPIVWNGDPTTDWGFDGLASAVQNALSMGLSGISTWGSDVGGFFALGQRSLSPELLVRWIQLGAVSPVMRTQANGIAIPPGKRRPQVWDDEILPHWRRWAKLHTQLYPYVDAAEREYRRSGMPIVRHMALAYPDDAAASGREDQFMFGPDLLAAPVLQPGATTRRVHLPPGRWVDLWRSAGYRERDGAHVLGRARTLPGGGEVELPAPLEELPLLARAGALIPMLAPGVDTLAGYGDGGRQVKLSQRRGRLRLLAFPRGRTRARFGAKGTLVSRERRRGWQLRLRGPRRRYALQASLTTLRRPFVPCRVWLRGRRLPARAWRYDRGAGVLRARFRARKGVLRVDKRPSRGAKTRC